MESHGVGASPQGVRVLPGHWRPHYPYEHIVWISPPWVSQDYVWLDFPEAVFTERGLWYLSHVNPSFPKVHDDPPAVEWQMEHDGIAYQRSFPDGVVLRGWAGVVSERAVRLRLTLVNGSNQPLTRITLQTCLFLRAAAEFNRLTLDNKVVRVPGRGWLPFGLATMAERAEGSYRLGWRGGRPLAELPIIACLSSEAPRLVAMTWHRDTLSLVGNPNHPCLHADPCFPDLAPGQEATIHGHVFFHEGDLQSFDVERPWEALAPEGGRQASSR